MMEPGQPQEAPQWVSLKKEMLHVAQVLQSTWLLQPDKNRRPGMQLVVGYKEDLCAEKIQNIVEENRAIVNFMEVLG